MFGIAMLGIGAIVGGVTGVFMFIRITGGTGAASEPISAPTLSLDTFSTPTMLPGELTPSVVTGIIPTVVNASVPQVANAPTPAIVLPQLFRIVSEESEARFSVYETFPVGTAIGRTNQIAGDIIVDFNEPANSEIGTIRINLRTMRTGDSDRDRSIRCCVLLTARDAYEFSDFVPTTISRLPEQIEIGQAVTFQVTGNLTLRGNIRPVTFNVSLSLASLSELRGRASTTVNRSDFGILNDDQNGFDYHGVEEEVSLEFDFVARAVQE